MNRNAPISSKNFKIMTSNFSFIIVSFSFGSAELVQAELNKK